MCIELVKLSSCTFIVWLRRNSSKEKCLKKLFLSLFLRSLLLLMVGLNKRKMMMVVFLVLMNLWFFLRVKSVLTMRIYRSSLIFLIKIWKLFLIVVICLVRFFLICCEELGLRKLKIGLV